MTVLIIEDFAIGKSLYETYVSQFCCVSFDLWVLSLETRRAVDICLV